MSTNHEAESVCRCDDATEHDNGGCDYTHLAWVAVVAERRRIEGSAS